MSPSQHSAPTTENTDNDTPSDETPSFLSPSFLSRQYSADAGGMDTCMCCPFCGKEIRGSYLPIFKCPHCEILIWRDEKGDVISYEQRHTCPECGYSFSTMSDESSTDFRRICHSFEQKTEGVLLRLERMFRETFA
jgi:predicted RNA-binding Zn-ribbon protein involved in translation (DUF1610 family)